MDGNQSPVMNQNENVGELNARTIFFINSKDFVVVFGLEKLNLEISSPNFIILPSTL